MKMLRHDIADKRFLELIEKFLKVEHHRGSPIFEIIYLHDVLDNCFDVIVKRQCSGECYLIRYSEKSYALIEYLWFCVEVWGVITTSTRVIFSYAFVWYYVL